MEIGNTVIGIHHRQVWASGQTRIQICLYLIPLSLGQTLNLIVGITNAVVGVHTQLGKDVCMLVEGIAVIRFYGVTENNWVRHLHHCCFQMQGKQNALLCAGNLFVIELAKGILAHERRIYHFASTDGDSGRQRFTTITRMQNDREHIVFRHGC